MGFTTLIDTASLAEHLADPAFLILDCRFDLHDTAWGNRSYEEGHIPGAGYVSLDGDLSGAKNGLNGRHPLPDPDTLATVFSRLGIDSSTQVIAYDQDNGMYASRLWWLLRWLGHDQVAVLDGGFRKWTAEHRAVRRGGEHRAPRTFAAAVQPGRVVDLAAVERAVEAGDARLVDARAPERFRGETETLDRVAGHIPGAVNHFFKWNLTDEGTFRSPVAIRDRVHESIGSVSPDRMICYCGSGVTACHNLLALAHAGLDGGRLYVGSWSEWSSDPARPIELSPPSSPTSPR
jgi:thiosulfate/3-mercaptopyruvate sulfurtransferase